jgi:hypothetical protein
MKELRAATGRLEKEKVVLKMEASRAMEAHVQSAALASILASRLETLESTLACVARDTAAAAAVRAHAVQAGEVAVAETSWTSPGFGCHAGLGGGRAEVARLEDALHNLGRYCRSCGAPPPARSGRDLPRGVTDSSGVGPAGSGTRRARPSENGENLPTRPSSRSQIFAGSVRRQWEARPKLPRAQRTFTRVSECLSAHLHARKRRRH